MPAGRTCSSLRTALATAVLGSILTLRAIGHPQLSYAEVLILCLAALAFVTAAMLCVSDRVESRATAVLVAVGSGVGVVLNTTIGSPGEPARGLVWLDVAVLLLAVAIPSLLVTGTRPKARATLGVTPTLTDHGSSPRPRGRGRRPDRSSPASDPRA